MNVAVTRIIMNAMIIVIIMNMVLTAINAIQKSASINQQRCHAVNRLSRVEHVFAGFDASPTF